MARRSNKEWILHTTNKSLSVIFMVWIRGVMCRCARGRGKIHDVDSRCEKKIGMVPVPKRVTRKNETPNVEVKLTQKR